MSGSEVPAQRSGSEAVIQMRDEFLQLVAAYNAIGEYRKAMDAQSMAIELNKFEDDHHITEIVWPPKVIKEEDGEGYLESIDR